MLNFSVNEEIQYYKHIDIKSVENKIGTIPEDMKEAIELYNKALNDIMNNNEDIALIALKKAVAIYPSFYEAMNLMGVCYISLNEEERAKAMFNKVIQMEGNGLRASNYLDRLDGKNTFENEGSAKRRRKKKSHPASSWIWIKDKINLQKDSILLKKNILGFLLGILVMCFLWVIIPGTPINVDLGDIFKKTESPSPQVVKLEKENLELNNRLNDANEALKIANETEKQLREEIEQYSYWNSILRNLQKQAHEGQYKEVVTQIERDLAGLSKPADIAEEINILNDECKPKAVPLFYDSGREIYRSNSKNQSVEVYESAAAEYKMAISIIEGLEKLPSNAVNIYYYGGKAIALSQYPSKEEAEKEALRCFDAILDIAPNSEMASYARSRINEIENGRKINH